MSQLRQAKKLADYQPPAYVVSQLELTFELDPTATLVTAISQFKRQGEHQQPLQLDGQNLQLIGIWLNDQQVENYQLLDGQLLLPQVPAEFELKIIHPAQSGCQYRAGRFVFVQWCLLHPM